MIDEVMMSEAINRAKLFIRQETSDYCMFEKFEKVAFALNPGEISDLVKANFIYSICSMYEYYYINIEFENHSIELRISKIEEIHGDDRDLDLYCTIEVCMYEDTYEEVRTFDWTIKYFWMSLLSWD